MPRCRRCAATGCQGQGSRDYPDPGKPIDARAARLASCANVGRCPPESGTGGREGNGVSEIIKGYNYLLNGLAVCSGIAIFIAFLMIVLDVTIRILGFAPPTVTIAVVEYILLYFTLLAAPWLVRQKGHVFIDAGTQFLPPLMKKVVAKFVYAVCITSTLIFCWYSLGLLIETYTQDVLDVRGIDMPQWLLFAPMPICFFMVAVEFGRFLIGIDDMYGDRTDVRENM